MSLLAIAVDMCTEAMRYAIVVGDIISHVYEPYSRPNEKKEVVMSTSDWAIELVSQSLISSDMKDNIISRLSEAYMQKLSEKNGAPISVFLPVV